MILKLIKQIESQQLQINELKQDLSAKKSVEAKVQLVNSQSQERLRNPAPPLKRDNSERVLVEDKRMIMQVFHTAAILIQQSYRKYRLLKQARELE